MNGQCAVVVPACTSDNECLNGQVCGPESACIASSTGGGTSGGTSGGDSGSTTGSSGDTTGGSSGDTTGTTTGGSTTTTGGGSPTVSASNSTLSASPTSVAADGASTTTVTATLLDDTGTAVSGKHVALASSRGATDTILVISSTTNKNGVASFSVSSSTAGTPTLSAKDTTDTLPITQTADVTFTALAALQFVVGTQSPTPANPALFGSSDENISLTFTLKNTGGNQTTALALFIISATGPSGSTPENLWAIQSGADTCSTYTLAANQTCTVQINFLGGTDGTIAGDYTANLQARATTGGTATNAMQATAAYTANGSTCTPRGATVTDSCYSESFGQTYNTCVSSVGTGCEGITTYYCLSETAWTGSSPGVCNVQGTTTGGGICTSDDAPYCQDNYTSCNFTCQ